MCVIKRENRRRMVQKSAGNAIVCAIVGAMRNSVQCCEWAGRYFMNGRDHVTAAPPEADISH